jgi:hypothetical protein
MEFKAQDFSSNPENFLGEFSLGELTLLRKYVKPSCSPNSYYY